MAEYDAIAEQYRDSKRLPFREVIERRTLFELLGDIRGKTVLDLACGDGFYTRLLKQAGAAAVTGVDLSAEMIRLAEREEQARPLGCKYLQRDAAAFEPAETVDLVVATYLLNYARTGGQLRGFCQVCYDALRPGGRFAGINDNVRNPPRGTGLWSKYSFERSCPFPRKRGTRSCTRSSTRTAADSSSRISTSRPRPTDGPSNRQASGIFNGSICR